MTANRKKIAYCSPFIPAEWVAAHGLIPFFYRPRGGDRDGPVENRAGVCSFMRSFINETAKDDEIDAIIVTTVCDQMRRSVDTLDERRDKPSFLMHVPTTWQTLAAFEYYMLELKRLGRFLVRLEGEEPSNEKLSSTMKAFEKGRSSIFANPSLQKGNDLTLALNSLFENGSAPALESAYPQGIPVAVIGGPLSVRDLGLFTAIEKMGGAIVLDGTENGERMLPAPFDKRELAGDPFGALADAYFYGIPDVFKRPNNQLFAWLKKETIRRGVRGVILVRYVFCDCWHAEVSRIREWLKIPVVDLDFTEQDGDVRTATRIAAFMEAIR